MKKRDFETYQKRFQDFEMTTAQVVKMAVTVKNNSPIQDYVHPDDQTQPTLERIVHDVSRAE